jgi:hypothetical protein
MDWKYRPVPKKSSPVGCSPIIFVIVIAFSFFTLSASFPPLNNLIARYALCPTASDVYFKRTSGGSVEKINVYQDMGTTVVPLFCEYEDAPGREIDNDIVVITGFVVSAGLGALAGLIVYFVLYLREQVSNPA